MVRMTALHDIFRPAAPTESPELFQGRQSQLESVMIGLQEVGRHVIVYGERGVGKTSIAYMARSMFLEDGEGASVAIRVQCSDGDTFDSIWRRFGSRLQEEVVTALTDVEFAAVTDTLRRAETLLLMGEDRLSPDDVRRALKIVASRLRLLVIVDEFDRADSADVSVSFADVVKGLSDDLVKMTLLMVGVADNVSDLIEGHASAIRNLRQVAMPRMSLTELEAIVMTGYKQYRIRTQDDLHCDVAAAKSIARISQGFPYYTHLLAGAAGAEAIKKGKNRVDALTVFGAMVAASEDTDHAIKTSYTEAVSARADAQLDQTLLACALAEVDYLGYFSAASVKSPLELISGQKKSSGHFSHHLKRFASSASAFSVLEEKRIGSRVRYRFRDPLMKPFVLIKGIQSGMYPYEL